MNPTEVEEKPEAKLKAKAQSTILPTRMQNPVQHHLKSLPPQRKTRRHAQRHESHAREIIETDRTVQFEPSKEATDDRRVTLSAEYKHYFLDCADQ